MQPLREGLPVVVSKPGKGAGSQKVQMGAGRGGEVVAVVVVVVEEMVVVLAAAVEGSGRGSGKGSGGGVGRAIGSDRRRGSSVQYER